MTDKEWRDQTDVRIENMLKAITDLCDAVAKLQRQELKRRTRELGEIKARADYIDKMLEGL